MADGEQKNRQNMPRLSTDLIGSSPLHSDLTREEIAELAAGLEIRRFADSEVLMFQGAAPDGVYFIVSGKVSVAARLPGGGENVVAECGPGDLVGEMALLTRGGKRTATARALGAVDALFTDRRYFEAALNLLKPASLKVLRRLGLILARRLHEIRGRHCRLVDEAPTSDLFRTLPAGEPRRVSSFDVRAFLPILPCFREFRADEIDVMFAAARVEDVVRGAILAIEGETSGICRLVVRGALLLGQRRGESLHQHDILGPGRFASISAIVADVPGDIALIAAEDTTLLAFDAARFVALWMGQDRLALRLLEAMNAELVLSLATAINHLNRLTARANALDFPETK